MADFRLIQRTALRNGSLYTAGEIDRYLKRTGRAQQELDRLSPFWNLCANCHERPRKSETICLCEQCYAEILPEIEAAIQDVYKATDADMNEDDA